MTDLETTRIWRTALAAQSDEDESARSRLREAYREFRNRVAKLVEAIKVELPDLTVHDITHLDAMWRVAGEIVGPNYQVNPAEAFVLGGAILLHDAAHVLAAYKGGLADIKTTIQWRDLIAQKFRGTDPDTKSVRGKAAVFEVLRQLHAQQAEKLLSLTWRVPGTDTYLHLLGDDELRHHYGDLIGQIASSHHWSVSRVAQVFSARRVTAPGFLSPASWVVDTLKVALMLRTADAAHIDDRRAPLFAFALRQPEGVSLDHWQFQSKLGQPTASGTGELLISSASTFSVDERKAWWLAYDTACMVDRELRDAHSVLREERREPFAVTSVLGATSAEAFANHVQCKGWTPVDVRPRINDVPHVVEMLGGAKLYGDDYSVPIRELMQNACDAVRALRTIGGLDDNEGEVVLSVEKGDGDGIWVSITDTGIGMSRHALTYVLLDFGHSLWGSDHVREEWPGLASKDFAPAGQFGIGFFSVFMLGQEVRVSTRRHVRYENEESDQWTLGFDNGLQSRPWLRKSQATEELPRAGTRVAVRVPQQICDKVMERWHAIRMQGVIDPVTQMMLSPMPLQPEQRRAIYAQAEKTRPKPWLMTPDNFDSAESLTNWSEFSGWLCPASEVTIKVRCGSTSRVAVAARDWESLPEQELLNRLRTQGSSHLIDLKDSDKRVIGRLGLNTGITAVPATLVHRGIRCGQFGIMTGLAIAETPTDVRRQRATLCCKPETWREWLEAVFGQNPIVPLQVLRILHAIDPSMDMPIAIMNGQVVRMSKCEEQLTYLNQFTVCYDDLGRMAWDPPWGFDGSGLALAADVWILPARVSHRIEEVPASHREVEYRQLLEARIAKVWGKFTVQESIDRPIAMTARQQPIIRETYLYSRAAAAP
jgi:hypothetical protein